MLAKRYLPGDGGELGKADEVKVAGICQVSLRIDPTNNENSHPQDFKCMEITVAFGLQRIMSSCWTPRTWRTFRGSLCAKYGSYSACRSFQNCAWNLSCTGLHLWSHICNLCPYPDELCSHEGRAPNNRLNHLCRKSSGMVTQTSMHGDLKSFRAHHWNEVQSIDRFIGGSHEQHSENLIQGPPGEKHWLRLVAQKVVQYIGWETCCSGALASNSNNNMSIHHWRT